MRRLKKSLKSRLALIPTPVPNSKIPALMDRSGAAPVRVFESGAILLYLAEKTGRLLPSDFRRRVAASEWLMWQMGGLGPMCGQAHHFRAYAPETIPYAVDRYTNEAARLYKVLDIRLGESDYLAGEYTIADMAVFPWLRSYERQGQDLNEFPHVKRWFEAINDRPAVQRGLQVLSDKQRKNTGFDKKQSEVLFGKTQYQR